MSGDLHLVSIPIDCRRLFASTKQRGLSLRELDMGYLLHTHLAALFGDMAPKPFVSQQAGRDGSALRVLGYSAVDAVALSERAATFADPVSHSTIAWDAFASKPMPLRWREGHRLGFEVRVCPTSRSKKGEQDVFLAKVRSENLDDEPSRENVYQTWLRQQLEKGEVVTVDAITLDRFQLSRALRRTQGEQRRAHRATLPDAVMSGVVSVRDPERVLPWLARGVGRHRAFGFGMILLRPAP